MKIYKKDVIIKNMKIEREKKYLVDEKLFQNLRKKAIYKLGVIQWYLEKCIFIKEEKCRIRYTIDSQGRENWVVAFKSHLFGDYKRLEEEYEVKLEDLSILKEKPVIAKIRYFLLMEKTEVIVDEFIELDYPLKVKYLAEIETDEEFKKFEEMFSLSKAVKDFEEYTNKNLARVSKFSPEEIIRKVQTMI